MNSTKNINKIIKISYFNKLKANNQQIFSFKLFNKGACYISNDKKDNKVM
jgi:hypothetical protein